MVILQFIKKINILVISLILALVVLGGQVTYAATANQEVRLTVDLPYSLAADKPVINPGGKAQMRIAAENYSRQEKLLTISLQLPPGVNLPALPEGWVFKAHPSGIYAQTKIRLDGGYGHWFELIELNIDDNIGTGVYSLNIAAASADGHTQSIKARLPITGEKTVVPDKRKISLMKVVLPLQQDGKTDLRMNPNTLILEDGFLAELKVFLSGKGVASVMDEQDNPVTYMGIEFANPQAQQMLVVVKIQLLDKNTKQPVPGLVSAANDTDNLDASSETNNGSRAMFALSGSKVQQIIVPIYADEKLLSSGEYILQVKAQEINGDYLVQESNINVITRNSKAAIFTILALVLVMAATTWGLFYWRWFRHSFKTRWLVTIALFGTTGFAVVTLPHTFLNDVFHILLGPFGFLVTGMFNGIILYMLIVCLVVLIPRPGTAALMTVVRMMLSMLAFGHVSPVGLLIYGSQAVCLEVMLYLTGITRTPSPFADLNNKKAIRKAMFMAVMACGIADAAATYVNLNSLAFLYRLYYAGWYISLCVLINGFIYPAIGAISGVLLGKQMREVGGE